MEIYSFFSNWESHFLIEISTSGNNNFNLYDLLVARHPSIFQSPGYNFMYLPFKLLHWISVSYLDRVPLARCPLLPVAGKKKRVQLEPCQRKCFWSSKPIGKVFSPRILWSLEISKDATSWSEENPANWNGGRKAAFQVLTSECPQGYFAFSLEHKVSSDAISYPLSCQPCTGLYSERWAREDRHSLPKDFSNNKHILFDN